MYAPLLYRPSGQALAGHYALTRQDILAMNVADIAWWHERLMEELESARRRAERLNKPTPRSGRRR